MSRLAQVIKQKNAREKENRERIKDNIRELNKKTYFKSKLQTELRKLDLILEQEGVKSVIVSIPDKSIALFTEALYEGELSEFEFRQMRDANNEFEVSKAYIDI